MSVITQTDFYKTGHYKQYPENTQLVYSNLTPRSSRLFKWEDFDGKIVFFGLQAFIKEYLIEEWNNKFFSKPKESVISYYKRRMDTSLGVDAVSVSQLEELHDLGYLPIEIRALPEGTKVPIGVPVFTIHNTLPEFFWLTNFLETVMSCELWKPSTVATIAHQYKKMLNKYAEETGGDASFTALQGHDFSFRGMSGRHDAAMSGMGHLISFVGTDTIPAIDAAEEFYYADAEKELTGTSVPASEHSVMCMGGKETEIETFRRLIEDVYPKGIVSIVSDTWDFWGVVGKDGILEQLKDKIMARQPDALGLNKVVVRPDSGDPVKIICGLKVQSYKDAAYDWLEDGYDLECDVIEKDGKYYEYDTDAEYFYEFVNDRTLTLLEEVQPEIVKGAIECLWDIFGGTINEKGYKVLDPHIGLIYGDSITLDRAKAILEGLKEKGFCSTNVVFGIGSYTYQYITRDTFGWAIKATAGNINGQNIAIQKAPITDKGSKKSASGFLVVDKDENGEYYLIQDQTEKDAVTKGYLGTVFKDGKLVSELTFQQVRQNLLESK